VLRAGASSARPSRRRRRRAPDPIRRPPAPADLPRRPDLARGDPAPVTSVTSAKADPATISGGPRLGGLVSATACCATRPRHAHRGRPRLGHLLAGRAPSSRHRFRTPLLLVEHFARGGARVRAASCGREPLCIPQANDLAGRSPASCGAQLGRRPARRSSPAPHRGAGALLARRDALARRGDGRRPGADTARRSGSRRIGALVTALGRQASTPRWSAGRTSQRHAGRARGAGRAARVPHLAGGLPPARRRTRRRREFPRA